MAKRKRLQKKEPRRLPKLPIAQIRRVLQPVFVTLAIAASLFAAAELLDRPIQTVRLDGPFQRVSQLDVEAIVREQLMGGYLSTDLSELADTVAALPWVDTARVRRRWPDAVELVVTEQVAAARWGARGLLNTRGELFFDDARHVPAELPRLEGPQGSEKEVAGRYLVLSDRLKNAGHEIDSLTLDAMGSWRLRLVSGIELRLGREPDKRVLRFVTVIRPLIAPYPGQVEYIDMRYSNGFAIGWESRTAAARTEGNRS